MPKPSKSIFFIKELIKRANKIFRANTILGHRKSGMIEVRANEHKNNFKKQYGIIEEKRNQLSIAKSYLKSDELKKLTQKSEEDENEKFKAIDDAYQADDKKAAADARTKLARAFRDKAKSVNEKYIVPPKTTDFAIVYAPTESLFSELSSYQDPSTKELLTQELMKKYKVVILGPNTLSAYLQSLHMGFQTLKVQKHATEIYDHLRNISTRFSKHFDNVLVLRKKLEEAMGVVDTFGKEARSITRTLENIKDPEQVEIAAKTENVEKFVDHSKQLKN